MSYGKCYVLRYVSTLNNEVELNKLLLSSLEIIETSSDIFIVGLSSPQFNTNFLNFIEPDRNSKKKGTYSIDPLSNGPSLIIY